MAKLFSSGCLLINVKKFKDENIDIKYYLDNTINKAGYKLIVADEGIINPKLLKIK